MTTEQLKTMMRELFRLCAIKIGEDELNDYANRLSAIAITLNLRRNDEAFAFLALNIIPLILSKQEMQSYYATIKKNVEKLQGNLVKLTEQADEAAKVSTLEIAKNCSKSAITKTLAKWIGGAILLSCLSIAGFGWFIHSSSYEAGKQAGMVEQRNEELILQKTSEIINSELGQNIIELVKSGFLDNQRLKFLQSEDGKRIYEYYETGDLPTLIKFVESPIYNIVNRYDDQDLTNILLCKKKDWEIQKHSSGKDACFPKNTGFYIPDGLK